jgi:Tol biopolymer transport system component
VIITDGKQGELFDDVSYLTISRYGTTVAYRAKQNGKWFVVVNDKKGPVFDSIEDGPTLSEDGSKAAYAAYESWSGALLPGREFGLANAAYQASPGAQRKILMIGDKRQELDLATVIYGLTFNPDGSKVAYKARKNGKYCVMNDGVRGPDYDMISALAFAPDGGKLAYTAYQSGKWFVVVGDARGPSFDDVYSPYFSPDSSRIAYVAKQADKRVMIVSQIDKMWPGAGYNAGSECDVVYAPIFSVDGSAVAYGAVQGKQILWKAMKADNDSQRLFDK